MRPQQHYPITTLPSLWLLQRSSRDSSAVYVFFWELRELCGVAPGCSGECSVAESLGKLPNGSSDRGGRMGRLSTAQLLREAR
uniref:Uncharacterized protein n=1 Tax=Setaria digitata TaxID=48799 RepID=A0A915PU44_9BILA